MLNECNLKYDVEMMQGKTGLYPRLDRNDDHLGAVSRM